MIRVDVCALCEQSAELRNSHIIPKFVFTWLRDTSPTGHLRQGSALNKRIQDGFKQKLLCGNCEVNFSVYENNFKTAVFDPATRREYLKFRYGSWLSKFAASLAWRCIQYAPINEKSVELSAHKQALFSSASAKLGDYLMNKRGDIGRTQLHMYEHWCLREIMAHRLPGNWSRYSSRHTVIDLIAIDGFLPLTIYAKLGPISIWYHILAPTRRWKKTRLVLNGGAYHEPEGLPNVKMLDYFVAEAEAHRRLVETTSDRQMDRISSDILSDLDRFKSVDSYEDIRLDAARAGAAAFVKRT